MFGITKIITFISVFLTHMDIAIIIGLLIIGILLLMAEIFLFPGISVAGISGFLVSVGAIIFAYARMGDVAGHITLIISIVALALSVWWFMRSKAIDKLALQTDIDGKVEPLKGLEIEEGSQGKTISRLAPMGKIKVNGAIMEAKALDDFIDEETAVEVLKVLSTNVIVKKLEDKY